jgi:ubiquinone/menaquinone biosynthesis C-methylase UbiE
MDISTSSPVMGYERPVRGHMRCYQKLQAALRARLNGKYERLLSERKQQLFSTLRGRVLEIGPGTGENLAYFALSVQWTGVEPNSYMHPYLHETARPLGVKVDLKIGKAECLPADDDSVDAVVSTIVLCSVKNPQLALSEVLRVLKPGGRFFFIEHVAAPSGTQLGRLQRLASPIFRVIADGCRPDLEIGTMIREAGFSRIQMQSFDVPIGLIRPHIMGIASK